MSAAAGSKRSLAATTCADEAIEQLHRGGITVCFANPGTTEMWLVSALEKQPGIRSILGLHEAVCTGACDGYARIARSPAMALLHLGPGLGNGLCNLHNARRAGSPVVVLVGEMATWHKAADPPLNQDIAALASTAAGAIFTIASADNIQNVIRAALAAAQPQHNTVAPALTAPSGSSSSSSKDSCCPGSKVVTVIFPHDISWTPTSTPTQPAAAAAAAAVEPVTAAAQQLSITGGASPAAANGVGQHMRLTDSPAACQFLADCAAALRKAPRGKAALLLGGAALLSEDGALATAGRIAASLGAGLLCEPLPGRIDRGAGLPHCTRVPYFPQEASQELAKYDVLVLVDVRRPVASFGYKDGPSQLLSQSDDAIWELDAAWSVAEALALLETHIPGAAGVTPGVLTAAALCQTVAALQPKGTILVDESLTSGTAYWEASKGCPPFTHLCLTGGAIGSGPPLATGAAVAAAAGRQVINLQADGSAMYTLQALWTQAREKLKVLTIICANNSYAILKVEAMRQRTGSNALTMLEEPAIDWVSLANGLGMAAGRAETVEQLADLIVRGLNTAGPFLIHAALK